MRPFKVTMLNIFPDAIEDAASKCETAMTELGFSWKETCDMHDMVEDDLEETGRWRDITNSVIGSYFRVTKDLICQQFPDTKVEYYVNCHDSHLCVNGEEIYAD